MYEVFLYVVIPSLCAILTHCTRAYELMTWTIPAPSAQRATTNQEAHHFGKVERWQPHHPYTLAIQASRCIVDHHFQKLASLSTALASKTSKNLLGKAYLVQCPHL